MLTELNQNKGVFMLFFYVIGENSAHLLCHKNVFVLGKFPLSSLSETRIQTAEG